MAFNDKIKELIAIAASVSAHCQPCLEFHTSQAKQAGASASEITEAIEVGKMVSKGASVQMQRTIIKVMGGEDHTHDQSPCKL